MNCTIYRSEKKAYTYLYLAEGTELDGLPKSLLGKFGLPEMVMDLDLSTRKSLAHADLEVLKSQLLSKGFYLQLAPEQAIDELLDRRFNPSA